MNFFIQNFYCLKINPLQFPVKKKKERKEKEKQKTKKQKTKQRGIILIDFNVMSIHQELFYT